MCEHTHLHSQRAALLCTCSYLYLQDWLSPAPSWVEAQSTSAYGYLVLEVANATHARVQAIAHCVHQPVANQRNHGNPHGSRRSPHCGHPPRANRRNPCNQRRDARPGPQAIDATHSDAVFDDFWLLA